ncbi:Na(+)/H(+) antiporter NhaD isoform X1 [Prunus yedoensis var. nudiflora]|uniref:Na(+)/H(+) antiporter NhaD isoform X1 n=1 Tax=Prunus yedoensis var. nudiflora TaxID=2094558 RepID=A0A314UZ83_PRUYE|nr:Na(+)/H(+) antiporter NhaD isoform X1 [Prunus yedoensis var. nudiflora]
MASLSIGFRLPPSHHHLKKRLLPFLSQTQSLSPSQPCFGSSLRGIRGSRLLGSGILARAEDKARGSNSSSSSAQQQQVQPSSEKEFQDLSPSSGSCDPLCSVDETSSHDFEANYRPKTDLLKAIAVLAAAATGAVAINHSWVAANQDVAMALLFGIGYVGIIFEESLAFNKSGVEIVDSHQGFKLVTDNITTRKPRTLLWVVGFATFFLSSILDNLTSTIVMVSLLRKLVPPSEFRKYVLTTYYLSLLCEVLFEDCLILVSADII